MSLSANCRDWIEPEEVDESDINLSDIDESDEDVVAIFCILEFAAATNSSLPTPEHSERLLLLVETCLGIPSMRKFLNESHATLH